MVHGQGLVCIFALGENYGFATVQPVATDSPQDCRIYSFESLPARSAKENRGYPVGILCFLCIRANILIETPRGFKYQFRGCLYYLGGAAWVLGGAFYLFNIETKELAYKRHL